MEKTRPILYGVADYALLRQKNAWFVDRTAMIRDLENTAYAVFLRPRRFGKSLLLSMLEYYYDVAFADRFDELFGGTDIGASPTDERGKYLVLTFDFSAVSKEPGRVQDDFNAYTGLCCDTFARKYDSLLPDGLAARILGHTWHAVSIRPFCQLSSFSLVSAECLRLFCVYRLIPVPA